MFMKLLSILITGGMFIVQGPVDRSTLESYYQSPGDVYDDTKTEGAIELLADYIDGNYEDAQNVTTEKIADGAVTSAKLSTDATVNESVNNVLIRALESRYNRQVSLKERLEKIGNLLSTGITPASVLLLGDSTGNWTDEWFYLTMEWFTAKFPTHTVTYRLWNDTNQSYDAPSTLQTGSNGDAYVTLSGTAGGNVSAPDNARLRITGDIEIIAKIAADVWALGGSQSQTIVSKFGGAGNRGYALAINDTGNPYFWWSSDGTANTLKTSTAAIPVSDGVDVWLKVTFDVDNGASGNTVKFYTSTDGETYTQLGTDVVTAGTTSIFASTAQLEIGSRSGGATEMFAGKIYEVLLKNGINGKIVASPDFDQAFVPDDVDFLDAEGNRFTINGDVVGQNGSPGLLLLNGSKPGANLAYSADVTRFALQTPIEPQLTFISYGHNEGDKTDYTDEYQAFIDQILTKYPDTLIVAVAQNPQYEPNPYPEAHATRCEEIIELAEDEGYGLLDVFDAFTDTGLGESLSADGTHPNAAGTRLWKNVAMNFLKDVVTE